MNEDVCLHEVVKALIQTVQTVLIETIQNVEQLYGLATVSYRISDAIRLFYSS